MQKVLLGATALLMLAGCAGPAPAVSPTPNQTPVPPTPVATLPPLSISNTTTLVVTLVLNDQPIVTVPAGVQFDPVPALGLPPLPWAVEARSPSGRVLVSMTVRAGDVRIGPNSAQGDANRVDLSCGRLDIWAGPPMLGPVQGPGSPGDCAP